MMVATAEALTAEALTAEAVAVLESATTSVTMVRTDVLAHIGNFCRWYSGDCKFGGDCRYSHDADGFTLFHVVFVERECS